MRIRDWSSDVFTANLNNVAYFIEQWMQILFAVLPAPGSRGLVDQLAHLRGACRTYRPVGIVEIETAFVPFETEIGDQFLGLRSEEHTSELQSLMRISYAVFCLKKTNINYTTGLC